MSSRLADASWYRIAAVSALGGALLWSVSMLSFASVRAHPHLSLVVVVLTMVVPLILVAESSKSASRGMLAAAGAGAAGCLLVFGITVSTYALRPELVPDISGPTCCAGGLTQADRTETNRIESTDPYVAELLIGSMLTVVFIGGLLASRPRRRSPGVLESHSTAQAVL